MLTCNLIHHQLCPLSRQIRVLLSEIGAIYTLKREDYWLRREELLTKSPFGILPILEMTDCKAIIGPYPIIEFLHEKVENFFLMPNNVEIRNNIRQQVVWFNDKFYREVSKVIVDEKVIKPITKLSEPKAEFLRIAKNNLVQHFKLLEKILQNNLYLVGEQITCADIVATSHISIIDYFGEISWDRWAYIKEWYALMKSRPSVRLILEDRIPGLLPPTYYSDPDF
ncbi:MAG: glutathione S-transferase family protein [Rickettsiaceae bacterium]|nr:glutathione S-transferase family protein [Rickettsiaceae bacterium]